MKQFLNRVAGIIKREWFLIIMVVAISLIVLVFEFL
jgi:hypothetical protein